MANYEHSAVEAKWQKYWEKNNTFHTDVWDFSKPKYYVLDMFPYPSGVCINSVWSLLYKLPSNEE